MSDQGDDRGRCQGVFDQVYAERLYQARKWAADGTPEGLDEHDDRFMRSPEQWLGHMLRYMGTWQQDQGPGKDGYRKDILVFFRKGMVKVMALALGAILWTDRRLAGVR